MTTPLVPNKVCCTGQQDNLSGEQNGNESVTGLDDTNANQIFSTNQIHEQVQSSKEKIGGLCTWPSENVSQLSEDHSNQSDSTWGPPTSDLRLQSPMNTDLGKDYMTDDAKDSLKTFSAHGQSPLNYKASTCDRSSAIPMNRASESSLSIFGNNFGNVKQSDRVKGIPYVKSGIISPRTEPFVKERISPTSSVNSPSKYLQCFETSSFGIRATDSSTPADHLFGLSSHILSSTSEEKKIVFYSKTPTSDTSAPEFSVGEEISDTNKQSTVHPTATDQHTRITYKPQVNYYVTEAQVCQGQITKSLETVDSKCMSSKSTCRHKPEQVMMEALSGPKRVDNTSEIRTSPLLYPSSEVNNLQESSHLVNQTGKFLSSSPKISSLSNSNLRSDEYAADTLEEETKIQTAQASDHQDHCALKNRELSMKPAMKKTTSGSESLDNKAYLNKDRGRVEEYICQDSDNNFVLSSNMTSIREKTAAFGSKKTVLGIKHQTDVLKGSMKDSHKNSTDLLSCSSTASCPVAAVNINDHCVASSSSFKDLNAVNVDRLSPSTVLPPIESTQLFNISPKATNKTLCSSAIPKPILIHSKPSLANKSDMEINYNEKAEETIEPNLIIPKPKQVRPKIITYIRRNPQTVDRLPFGQMSMPFVTPCNVPIPKEHEILSSDINASNILLEKYKSGMDKPRIYSAGLVVSGIRPPGHPFGQINEKSLAETGETARKEEFCSPTFAHYEVPPSFYRSTMILKPQLGLGAVSRLPSAKSRILIASQRSSIPPQEQGTVAGSDGNSDASEDLKKGSIPNGAKSNLPKPCQSGLRPPGYSRLPAAKLAAFGFVRSSSVSSLSSNQSNESIQSDPSRSSNTLFSISSGTSFANEEQSTQKTLLPSKDLPKGTSRTVLQVCSSTTIPRRSLLPAPKTTTSPAGSKKEAQKDHEVIKPTVSSPKRQVVSTNKIHSPGHPKLRPAISKNGYSAKPEVQTREADRQVVQKLKEKCEEQAKKLLYVQEELKKASCGFVVFAVTTQYFFQKNESILIKEKELSVELTTIRDEVAFNIARCEKLQKEKEELEIKFDNEVRKLERQQEEEVQALKDRLQLQYNEELERLRKEQNVQLVQLRSQHQEQIENMAATYETSLSEMRHNHSSAIRAMQDDHENCLYELKESHELQKKNMEDNFEKVRLSLQDQVDTLTFQNHSLRDRAKRFEEALTKSTREQFEIALAPYRHLDEDLNSVKQVLEMKNQLIHQQEKKIMELEKLAEINIILEERVQVLQQQNEDMKVRIDKNVAVTRQLSVENANLQESVEKESKEKNRLSRTNEELVWKLQSAESMSPVKVTPSPMNHSVSGPLSPSKSNTSPR
ncbi:microtubule-associated tumor suppressor candidate 2 [Rhinophrynus dorsalis]